MMPAIIKCEDRFLEILKKTKGEPIDIRKYVGPNNLSLCSCCPLQYILAYCCKLDFRCRHTLTCI